MDDDEPIAEKKVKKVKKKKLHRKSRVRETESSEDLSLSVHFNSTLAPHSAMPSDGQRQHVSSEGERWRPKGPISESPILGKIDYVLYYKMASKDNADGREMRRQKRRERFEKLLQNEHIEVGHVQGDGYCYVTLHCPFHLLACEAERIRLEMPLKDLKLNPDASKCTSALDSCFKTDFEDDYVSVPFEQSKAKKFRDWDDEGNFFRPALRGLLVHSFLSSLSLDEVMEEVKGPDENETSHTSRKGLPYLLLKRVYSDAFILHDESEDQKTKLSKGRRPRADKGDHSSSGAAAGKRTTAAKAAAKERAREELDRVWPFPFKYQPMWMIRNYFGEEIALYFAWIGVLTWSIVIPALFGFAIFVYGIWLSVQSRSIGGSSSAATNSTATSATSDAPTYATFVPNGSSLSTNSSVTIDKRTTTSVIGLIVTYGDDLLYTIKDALDNEITPWYSIIICLWGTIFLELWKRRNAVLAFEWDVDQYEANEIARPEYEGVPKFDRVTYEPVLYYSAYRRAAKIFTSLSLLIVMVCVVIMVTVAVVVYRVFISVEYCQTKEWSSLTCTVMTSLVATTANAIVILILSMLYEKLAYLLTDWENHETSTDYKDALIIKLFAFLFTNNFASLYYIAFFRGNRAVTGSSGFLGLGGKYSDSCSQNNDQVTSCMPMLSLQILILIIIKPIISTARELLMPVIVRLISRLRKAATVSRVVAASSQDSEVQGGASQSLLAYLDEERSRPALGDFTLIQYTDKVIQYGYLMMFAVSMPLAPIIVLLVNIIDRPIDSRRILWKYRRPVAHRAQDIGTWYYTLDFLNICGVITNACLIALTSKWGNENLTTGCDQLAFILAYEHAVFALKYIIAVLVPDVPNHVKKEMRREKYLVAKVMNSGQFVRRRTWDVSPDKVTSDFYAPLGNTSGRTLPPLREPSGDRGYK